MRNIALVADKKWRIVAHRADCPDVRKMAAEGEPVLTMFECANLPPLDVKKHSCLETGAS